MIKAAGRKEDLLPISVATGASVFFRSPFQSLGDAYLEAPMRLLFSPKLELSLLSLTLVRGRLMGKKVVSLYLNPRSRV